MSIKEKRCLVIYYFCPVNSKIQLFLFNTATPLVRLVFDCPLVTMLSGLHYKLFQWRLHTPLMRRLLEGIAMKISRCLLYISKHSSRWLLVDIVNSFSFPTGYSCKVYNTRVFLVSVSNWDVFTCRYGATGGLGGAVAVPQFYRAPAST